MRRTIVARLLMLPILVLLATPVLAAVGLQFEPDLDARTALFPVLFAVTFLTLASFFSIKKSPGATFAYAYPGWAIAIMLTVPLAETLILPARTQAIPMNQNAIDSLSFNVSGIKNPEMMMIKEMSALVVP